MMICGKCGHGTRPNHGQHICKRASNIRVVADDHDTQKAYTRGWFMGQRETDALPSKSQGEGFDMEIGFRMMEDDYNI